MSLVRLLLPNEALCQYCFLQVNKVWYRRLPSSAVRVKRFPIVHLTDLTSLCESSVSAVQVGSSRFSWMRMKHDARLQAAIQQSSESSSRETREAKVPHDKTTDTDLANFLREISVICERARKLGLPPSTQWQDHSAVEVVRQLHEAVESQAPSVLFRAISAFPSLSEVDDFVKQVIVGQLEKSMRHLSISQLLRIVQLQNVNSSLDQAVFDKAMSLLQQRWVEIKSGRDIVTLMYIVSDESEQFLDRLDDRALDLCDTMTVKELYRAVYCLARRRRRNTPLIRALMYYLDRQELDLGPIHLSNLAYAMGVLNVHDERVMEKLIKAVCNVVKDRTQPPNIVCHMLSSVVQSLGILRRFDQHFMDLAVERFMELTIDVSDWARLLHTLASVNYLPAQVGKNGIAEIMKQISSLSESNPLLWLDVVWSSCVLESVTDELAASVLSPEFVDKLQGTDGIETASFAARLLAVNAVARDLLPGYSKPLLSDALLDRLTGVLMPPVHSKNDLFNAVVEALSEIAPAERYLRTNVMLPSGHVIDAVMLMNGEGKPQPFDDDVSVSAAGVATDHHIHRIAFQKLEFADMMSSSTAVKPSGPSVLASRCCLAAGYKVVPVAYNEFDVTLPVVKRVQYLVRKVRDVIAQDSGSSETREPKVIPVTQKETKINIAVSSAPVTFKQSSGYLRKLLKSDDFLVSDVEDKIAQVMRSSLRSSFPESSSKKTKQKTRQKRANSSGAQIGLTDAPATENK